MTATFGGEWIRRAVSIGPFTVKKIPQTLAYVAGKKAVEERIGCGIGVAQPQGEGHNLNFKIFN